MNVLGYLVYFTAMGFIIGRVGWLFYRNGQHYVNRLFENDLALGNWVNRLLLKAYYLFNLGYVALSIQSWISIESLSSLIETTAVEIGNVLLILAIMHYVNMIWLQIYSDWRAKQKTLINIGNNGSN
jgi:hypothetical protein